MNHSIIVIIIIIGIGMSFRVNQLIFTVVDRCDQSQVRGVIDTARLNARIEDENESSSDEEMPKFHWHDQEQRQDASCSSKDEH